MISSDWLRGGRRRDSAGHAETFPTSAGATDDPLKFHDHPGAARSRGDAPRRARCADLRATGERLSWHDLKRRSDDVAAGLLALGVQRGDRVGHLGAELRRVGAGAVRHRPHRCDSGQHQPGLSRDRAGVCAARKSECRVLVMAARLKSSDYVAMLKTLAPELDRGSRVTAARTRRAFRASSASC